MSKRNPNKIKEGKTIYTVLVYVAVAFLCFLAVYPMYYVLIMSLSSPENAAQMNVYVIPKGFCVDAYKVFGTGSRDVESIFKYNYICNSDYDLDASNVCTSCISVDL